MGFWSRAGQGFTRGFSSTFDVGRELRVQREMRRQKAKQEKDRVAAAALRNYEEGTIGREELGNYYSPEFVDQKQKERTQKVNKDYEALIADYNSYTSVDDKGNPIIGRPDPRIVLDLEKRAARLNKHLTARLGAAGLTPDIATEDDPQIESVEESESPIDQFIAGKTDNVATSDDFLSRTQGQTAVRRPDERIGAQPVLTNEEQEIQDQLALLGEISKRLTDFNNQILSRNRSQTEFGVAINRTPITENGFVNFENSTRDAVKYGFMNEVTYNSTVKQNLESVSRNIYANQGTEAAERFLDRYEKKYPRAVPLIKSEILGMEAFRQGEEDERILETAVINKVNSTTSADNSTAQYLIATVRDSASLTQPVKDSLVDQIVFKNDLNLRNLEKEYEVAVQKAASSILDNQRRAFDAELRAFRSMSARTNAIAQADLRDANLNPIEEPTFTPSLTNIRKQAELQVMEFDVRFQALKDRNEYKKTTAFQRSGKIVNGAVDAYVAKIINRSASTDPSNENYYGNLISGDTALTISEQQIVKQELDQIDPEALRQSDEPARTSYSTLVKFIDPQDNFMPSLSGNDLAVYEEFASHVRGKVNRDQTLVAEDVRAQVLNKLRSQGADGYGLSNDAASSVAQFVINYAFRNPVNDTPLEPLVDVDDPSIDARKAYPQLAPEGSPSTDSLIAPTGATRQGNTEMTRTGGASNLITEQTFGRFNQEGFDKASFDALRNIESGKRTLRRLQGKDDAELIKKYLRENHPDVGVFSPRTQQGILTKLNMTYSELLNKAKNANQ